MPDLRIYDIFDFSIVRDIFADHGVRRILKRGDCFCHIGMPVNELALVVKGAFAFSRPDDKGNEQILSMAFENELLGAYIPMVLERCAELEVRALCRSEILVLPLDFFVKETECRQPGSNCRLLAAIAYGFMMRIIEQRCISPIERYERLTERIKGVGNIIPMSAIASYLGVSREAFARMRARRDWRKT